jgi:hypothetical protein
MDIRHEIDVNETPRQQYLRKTNEENSVDNMIERTRENLGMDPNKPLYLRRPEIQRRFGK